MKKLAAVLISLAAAVMIVMFSGYKGAVQEILSGVPIREKTLLDQRVERISSESLPVHKIYRSGELIGVLTDEKSLRDYLRTKYNREYKADYPHGDLQLDTDMYVTSEQSYFVYENIDDQIIDYIDKNDLVSVHTTAIEFAENGNVYAVIHVSDEKLYQEAIQEYLTYFIDSNELSLLNSGKTTPELHTYGSRTVGLTILQDIMVTEAYAKPAEIMTTKEEILEYLQEFQTPLRTVYRYDGFVIDLIVMFYFYCVIKGPAVIGIRSVRESVAHRFHREDIPGRKEVARRKEIVIPPLRRR